MSYQPIFDELKRYYSSLHATQRAMFPSDLAALLQDDSSSALAIFKTAAPYQRLAVLFPGLRKFFNHPMCRAWLLMNDNNQLSGEVAQTNFDALNGESIDEIIKILFDHGILNQTTLERVLALPEQYYFCFDPPPEGLPEPGKVYVRFSKNMETHLPTLEYVLRSAVGTREEGLINHSDLTSSWSLHVPWGTLQSGYPEPESCELIKLSHLEQQFQTPSIEILKSIVKHEFSIIWCDNRIFAVTKYDKELRQDDSFSRHSSNRRLTKQRPTIITEITCVPLGANKYGQANELESIFFNMPCDSRKMASPEEWALISRGSGRSRLKGISDNAMNEIIKGIAIKHNFSLAQTHRELNGNLCKLISSVNQDILSSGKTANETFNTLLTSNAQGYISDLQSLQNERILNSRTRHLVLQHRHPGKLWQAFTRLANSPNFGPISVTDLLKSDDVIGAAAALYHLNRLRLLPPPFTTTMGYNGLVPQFEACGDLSFAIIALSNSELLNSEHDARSAWDNFNQLLRCSSVFFTHTNNMESRHDIPQPNYDNYWARLPNGHITQEQFDEMVRIAEAYRDSPNEGRIALQRYVSDLTEQANALPIGQPQLINPMNSTHTESVHASASASATNLQARYGKLSPDELQRTLNNLFHWGKWLMSPNWDIPRFKLLAAKRCLKRLEQEGLAFTDPVSGINLGELLAYCWLAIEDDTRRLGRKKDVALMFIEGLYEAQRDGNISEQGVDLGRHDSIICLSGTFNKLIQGLVGAHPDFISLFLTKRTAAFKLKIVVAEEAKAFLSNAAHDMPAAEYQILMNNIQENASVHLWPHIVEQVSSLLFDEFNSLFPEGRTSEAFSNFVNSGQDFDFSGLLKNVGLLNEGELDAKPPEEDSASSSINDRSITHQNTVTCASAKNPSKEELREIRLKFFSEQRDQNNSSLSGSNDLSIQPGKKK